MGRKRKGPIPGETGGPIDKWIITTEMQINGRNVARGTELKITGERGRFRFIKHVKTETSEWIDVYGGPKGAECMRSFHLDKVKTVHYKNTTDFHMAKVYKEKMKQKKEEENEQSD